MKSFRWLTNTLILSSFDLSFPISFFFTRVCLWKEMKISHEHIRYPIFFTKIVPLAKLLVMEYDKIICIYGEKKIVGESEWAGGYLWRENPLLKCQLLHDLFHNFIFLFPSHLSHTPSYSYSMQSCVKISNTLLTMPWE